MRLVALKEFEYGGRKIKVGDKFETANAEDARLLKGFGKAKDARTPRAPTYERRDMVAES